MTVEDPQRRAILGSLVALGGAGIAVATGLYRLVRSPDTGPTGSSEPPSVSTSTSTTATPSTTSPPTATAPTTTSTVPPPIEVEVISQAGWDAARTGQFTPHTPVRLTYHHTASATSDPGGAPDRIRGYQRYHQQQGWPDVAYHFLIDQAGRIYQGRPVDAVGDTFTEYDPTGHFLACLDGDFETADPSPASIDALVQILAWAAQTFDIDPESLGGHRDHAATTCPGARAYALRDEIVAAVFGLLDRRIVLHLTD